MVFSCAVSVGREDSDDGSENDTPPTRSYVDALLGGNLSEAELANLRNEIGRSERPAQIDDDDDENGARTAFHTYSPEERQSARPSGYMAAVTLPPPDDDDDDDVKTLFRPSSQPVARPISEPAPRPPSQPGPRPMSQPVPSSRPRAGARPPSSAPPWSLRGQPEVDLGDLLDDEVPGPPTPAPASLEEVPLSVPSLRSLDPRAADESYLEAFGGPNSVPRIIVSPGELRCLPLGAQAGFVVSCIDGVSTIDDIIDISGQSRLGTLRILYDLVQQGVVVIA